jgi:hypothetical protein
MSFADPTLRSGLLLIGVRDVREQRIPSQPQPLKPLELTFNKVERFEGSSQTKFEGSSLKLTLTSQQPPIKVV